MKCRVCGVLVCADVAAQNAHGDEKKNPQNSKSFICDDMVLKYAKTKELIFPTFISKNSHMETQMYVLPSGAE